MRARRVYHLSRNEVIMPCPNIQPIWARSQTRLYASRTLAAEKCAPLIAHTGVQNCILFSRRKRKSFSGIQLIEPNRTSLTSKFLAHIMWGSTAARHQMLQAHTLAGLGPVPPSLLHTRVRWDLWHNLLCSKQRRVKAQATCATTLLHYIHPYPH